MCMICASSLARCDLFRWMGRLSPLKSVSHPFPSGRRVTVDVLQLLPLDEVVALMHAGEFKPNCAVGTLYVYVSSRSTWHLRWDCFASSHRFHGAARTSYT